MLPDMSDVLTEWEVPVKLKTVTRKTADFEAADIVVVEDRLMVVQPADKEQLNAEDIDWSLEYVEVHSKDPASVGQFVEWEGKDYKLITGGNYRLYGYHHVIGEETKKPLLIETPVA